MDGDETTDNDPRVKYRQLPPPVDPEDTIASVEPTDDLDDAPPDLNDGAAPYLRVTWGPWIR
jgi:hypothetical protein